MRRLGVDLDDPGHVARHVDDDRLVAGLAGQAGAGAPRQQGGPGFGSQAGSRLDVVLVAREDHAEGHLAVIGRVAGVGGAGGGVEAHFAREDIGQRPPEGVPLSFS